MRLARFVAYLAALGWAQNRQPWTAWDVYLDSLGNGQNPISGRFVCNQRLWIVVDTVGMQARGITGWTLYEATGFFPVSMVIYDDRDATVSPSNPISFPFSGLPNRRKVGIDVNPSVYDPTYLLTVRFANGDSATAVRRLRNYRPYVQIESPELSSLEVYCPGSSLSFVLKVPLGVDSFIVRYGPNPTDTLRNRRTFTLTVPNLQPWNIEITTYVCGVSQNGLYGITTDPFSLNTPLPLNPYVWPMGLCLGDSFYIQSDYNAYQGYFSDSMIVLNHNGTVVGGVRLNGEPRYWRPSAAGLYKMVYAIKYPCSPWITDEDTIFVRVYDASSTLPPIFLNSNNNAGSCSGTPVEIYAVGVGQISWDINYDGVWDTTGNQIRVTFSGNLPHRIRVRQELDCLSRIDTIDWVPPILDSFPNYFLIITPQPICPGGNINLTILPSANFSLSQAGSEIRITASWLNGGLPFRLWSQLDTLLPAPPNPGSYSVDVLLLNGCGKAYSHSWPLSVPGYTSSVSLEVLGASCRGSAGVVKVTSIPFSSEPPHTIRYILPDGSVVTPNDPTDTVTLTYPASDFSYFLVEKTYGCVRHTQVFNVPALEGSPKLNYFQIGLRDVCAGSIIPIGLSGREAQNVKIFVGNTLVYESGVPYQLTSWASPMSFYAYGSFRVPQGNGPTVVLAIAEGCGGVRDTLRDTLIIRPLPQLSNLSLQASGLTLTYSVSVAHTSSVRWDFGDGQTATGASGTHTYAAPGNYTVKVYAQNSCGEDSLVQSLNISTSLVDREGTVGWYLFPNPTRSEVYLYADQAMQGQAVVYVINPMGQVAAQYTIESLPARLPLSLPAGLYTLQVRSSDRQPVSFKLLITE
ncbi:MAG: PKD domain-containing protein [Bacteroidia bacterium]|nr:PKD domain-containing protein [Bacteroidia bacterium]